MDNKYMEYDITPLLLWDYKLPVMSEEVFIKMARRVVNIYSLDPMRHDIHIILEKMSIFMNTEFGREAFRQIIYNNP